MKAIILARVSTEEQKEAGNSLPAQITRLKNYCESKGFDVIKEYKFDESAYKTKRDNFDKILEYIESNKEKIIVCFDKVDRFSRNIFDKRVSYLYDLAMQDKIELHFSSDNLIITPNISAVEKFQFGISLGLAKYYSDAISDSVKRSNEKKILKGEILTRAPLGYLNVDDGKGGRTVVIEGTKAPYLVKIFKLYATGNYSMQRVAEAITGDGLRSRANNILKVRQIEVILKNPFYYGCCRYKDTIYSHKYDPLISYELWKKCEDVRNAYKKKPSKYSKKPFIFRGLIQCDRCGCMITPEFKKNKYVYYHCTNYKGNCEKIYNKQEVLLDCLKKDFQGMQLSQDQIDKIINFLKTTGETDNEFHNIQLKELQKEYKKIDNRASIMYDDKLDGCITSDMYDKKFKKFEERKYQINNKISKINKTDKMGYITANKVFSLAKRAYHIFKSSEPEEKRQLLNFLFQNFKLNGENLLYKLKTPFKTMLLVPKSENNPKWGAYRESNPN